MICPRCQAIMNVDEVILLNQAGGARRARVRKSTRPLALPLPEQESPVLGQNHPGEYPYQASKVLPWAKSGGLPMAKEREIVK